MACVADEDYRASIAQIVSALRVHFRHERAGGIEHAQTALGGLFLDLLRYAMSAEDRYCIRRHFGQFFNEACSARLEGVDHPFIMHNLVPYVDRRSVLIERALDNLDRAHDPRAEAARLRQNNLHPAAPLARPFLSLPRPHRSALSKRNWISSACTTGARHSANN